MRTRSSLLARTPRAGDLFGDTTNAAAAAAAQARGPERHQRRRWRGLHLPRAHLRYMMSGRCGPPHLPNPQTICGLANRRAPAVDTSLGGGGVREVAFVLEIIAPTDNLPRPVFLTQWNHRQWALEGVSRGYIGVVYPGSDAKDAAPAFQAAYPNASMALIRECQGALWVVGLSSACVSTYIILLYYYMINDYTIVGPTISTRTNVCVRVVARSRARLRGKPCPRLRACPLAACDPGSDRPDRPLSQRQAVARPRGDGRARHRHGGLQSWRAHREPVTPPSLRKEVVGVLAGCEHPALTANSIVDEGWRARSA
jgi:hypothetical protein